jgi:alkanesulfonate monooxygenase SsuD/methylene tetrahydromethanopterin reductase-like flavin-dependent oxidoreductase (luciferase family)
MSITNPIFHLKENITIYQMQNAIQKQFKSHIIRGWHCILLLGRDEKELKKRRIKLLDKKREWKDSNVLISGTPNRILNEITRYLKIGVTYFTIYFPDLPDTTSLKLFAEHVIPNIRNR